MLIRWYRRWWCRIWGHGIPVDQSIYRDAQGNCYRRKICLWCDCRWQELFHIPK